jgi:predicted Fe-Mo cluster-binding NifX family protein
VSTNDGLRIDEHFGKARILRIYDVSDSGEILGFEAIAGPGSEQGFSISDLDGAKFILTAKIGPHWLRQLAGAGIASFDLQGEILPAIAKIIEYEKKRNDRIAARKKPLQ